MSCCCLLPSLECPLDMHVCACTCAHMHHRHQHLRLLPLSHTHIYLSTSHASHTHTLTPQHHYHSIIFMGRLFPLPPPPTCTQLAAHSATPTSLPDNTAARHPIIFMHTHHTHSYTAVHSALCWQGCLSNGSELMHSSHVSAWYDYSIGTQTAEAGSPQVQRSNKERTKGGGSHFYFVMTFRGSGEGGHEAQSHPQATISEWGQTSILW